MPGHPQPGGPRAVLTRLVNKSLAHVKHDRIDHSGILQYVRVSDRARAFTTHRSASRIPAVKARKGNGHKQPQPAKPGKTRRCRLRRYVLTDCAIGPNRVCRANCSTADARILPRRLGIEAAYEP